VTRPKPGDHILACLHAHERDTTMERLSVPVTIQLRGVDVVLRDAVYVLCEECRAASDVRSVPCAVMVVAGEPEEEPAAAAESGRMMN